MPAATRKRLRDTPVEAGTPAASMKRRALASRIEPSSPHFWHHAASSNGVSGADSFLVYLGRSIAASLLVVTSSAETARAQLREIRAALHAASDARCDALGASIDSSEARKVEGLERELVSVDAALERWRAESAYVRVAVASLSDSDLDEQYTALDEQYTALSSRLTDMEARLQALPTALVEPPYMALLADAPALLSSIAGFGRVLAPLSITAADLTMEAVPSSVRPGDTLQLRLSLGARHAAQSAEELEVSLGWLAGATRVEATVDEPGTETLPLQAIISADASQHCVIVLVEAPRPCTGGSASLHIRSMHVAGQPVSGLPLCVPVQRRITTPLVLSCESAAKDYTSPCISTEGRVYCPPDTGPEVLVFDADGSPLPSLPVARLGLTEGTSWAAYADGEAPSLLLADFHGASSCLVAVDPSTHTVRWTTDAGHCFGVAALPARGVVVVGCLGFIFAHRLSDGIRVGSLPAPALDLFLTADSATGTVFGIVSSSVGLGVHAWTCASDGPGIRMSSNGSVRVAAAGTRGFPRPLAVIPPATGMTVSHLVVAAYESPELLVLSLPGLALVHTHMLEGMEVTGLAGDPWGGALAVCDGASDALHVLAWPLSGMPPLQ